MTRLYNIDGWHTYQDLHDRLGYTMQPSTEVSYVLSSDSGWGDDAGNHGYFSGLPDTDDQYDPSDGEYFEVDVYGWCSLDEMLSDVGLMPSNADTSIFMQKGSTISKAAVIAPPRLDPIYCVSAELESGWHTYDWWEDNGWEEAQPSSSLLFGGDFSGNDITLDSVDGGGNVIDRYNPGRALFPNTGWVDGTMIARYNPGRSLFELRGWEPGGCFWDVLGNFIIMDSTTGNVISSVQIGNTDLPIEIDVLEQPEIIDPTAPEDLLIGVTTECPAGTASLSSEYFWMYQFYQANSANWYTPRMFQNNNLPFYQTDNTMYPVGGSKYLEVILTNGNGGTFSPTEFKLSVYNIAPEFYMDTAYISENFDKNGAIVRYGSDIPTQSLNLPSDMYTISGTTITWDMSHPLMILLQGKPFVLGGRGNDTVTGTISSVILPTAHSGDYTEANFGSLRYYAKGTLSNTGRETITAFGITQTLSYGTLTWRDDSLGDLSDKIAVSSFDDASITPQSVFRIIFIYDSSITGYHPDDTTEATGSNFITSYTFNGGEHSITFYSLNNWTDGQYSGRIQFRYLDGTTTFKNLSAFNLIYISSSGVLSKDTATDRYDMYNVWGGDMTISAYYDIR